jgi:glycosyltransferase involved in cell wall biosynthesis
MKKVFLESHNLKNLFTGFGQFNFHLIKGLAAQQPEGIQLILHGKNVEDLKKNFGEDFEYKKYHSITRHKPFRIKKKYDLWHSLNQNIKIEPFYNIPYLLTVHDIHFITEGSEGMQQKLREQFDQKLKRSNAIVYISQFAKEDTHKHFDVPKVPEYVIYNGNTITDVSVSKDFKPSVLTNQKYLFSIGDFSPRKNFKTLVQMLPLLPQYDLVLAGSNSSIYAKELTQLAQELGVGNRVFQTGKIDDTAKNYYLKNCEALVFPSLREGFGIPPIEAMRFGKPVFISHNTSLPEIGGEHSFYWHDYNPENMAEVLIDGMSKYTANEEIYKNWYVNRAQHFNWNETAKQYMEVYRSVLGID